ncbi:MAG: VOC family protein [Candidatus Shapirobacteria bacterium]
MNTIQDLIGDYKKFLDLVFLNLVDSRIDVSSFEIDHIAYRATSLQSYNDISTRLSKLMDRANQKVIRNRNVDMYLFKEPLEYRDNKIKYLEIMAPAEGDKFKEGLEHAEFFLKKLDLHDFIKKHNQFEWNTNSIDREIGADVGLLFENGANAKFKNQSMAEIIEEEEKLKKLVSFQTCGLEGN